MATDHKEQRLFDTPEGYVGWAGNIKQPIPLFKMYVSCVPDDYIINEYRTYARSVGLEAITLHPRKDDERIGDVFFRDPFLTILGTKSSRYHQKHLTVL